MTEKAGPGDNKRITADFASAVTRHSISFVNQMQRKNTTNELLISSDYDSPVRGLSPQPYSKSDNLQDEISQPVTPKTSAAFKGFTLHQVRKTTPYAKIDTTTKKIKDDDDVNNY